jgi:hypothetical protein
VIRVYDDAGNVIETHEHNDKNVMVNPWTAFSRGSSLKITMKTVLAIAIGVALSLGVVDGKPEKVKPSELPAPVVNTIKQQFPDAKIILATKETPSAGRTPYYGVLVETKGQQWVFSVEENGKLLRPAQTPVPGR